MNENEKAIDLLSRMINRLKMPNVKVSKRPAYEIEFGKSTVGKRIIPDPSKRTTTIRINTEEE